ncbi:TPA: hypothetical protein UME25_000948 [Stenotrophomonas maltophilia]|uniref:HNH endonuclease n=1 Tax=Stenotrophomonas sp. Sm6012 TaxID=3002745 RepID=UPI0013117876|nr:hypothetical protein [Stenotrophomonas sp. Sm6012]MDQ7281947.1 hypothetical protein [Stenotrophomonas sp. Sm6012]HEL3178853.1 hypothetical protein [Stenotrophomonas maltophilia]
MKFLGHLKLDEVECAWLSSACQSKKRHAGALKRISVSLKSNLYKDYSCIVGSRADAPAPTKLFGIGEMLRGFYAAPPRGLAELLKFRRSGHDLKECPYCGNPFSPDTIDHFMPKDLWPEYAIFPNNLVPQCRGCAPIKGARFVCPTAGGHIFLHPFYSECISKLGFEVLVTHSHGKSTFEVNFVLPGDSTADDVLAIRGHLRGLKVKSRLLAYCNGQLRHWKNLVKESRFDVRASFRARIDEYSPLDRNSNWKVAFFKGMLACEQAMNALQAECPTLASHVSSSAIQIRVDV